MNNSDFRKLIARVWSDESPHDGPAWLLYEANRVGERYQAILSAYWMHCPAHGILIPRGVGECMMCPECADGVRHEGKLLHVTFSSTRPDRVMNAVRRALRLTPALYNTATHDLDAGEAEREERSRKAQKDIADMRAQYLSEELP